MSTSKKITIGVLILLTVILGGVSLFIALQINQQPDTSVADGVACLVSGGPTNWTASCSGSLGQSYKIVGYQCAQQGLSYCVPSNGGVPITVSANVAIQGNPTPSNMSITASGFPLGECGTVQVDTLAGSLDINDASSITGGKVANLGTGDCAGGGGGGDDTPPDPTGITIKGRVICRGTDDTVYPIAGATVQIIRNNNPDSAETVRTDSDGQYVYTRDAAANERAYRVQVTQLPSGSLSTGQPYASMTGPDATNCSNQAALECTNAGPYCAGNGSFYDSCNLPPGDTFNNFKFEYSNCVPTTAVCGGSCSADSQCPNNHVCQSNKCVLSTCATDPSKCEADKCTLLPDANCGATCSASSQCPTDHTCQNSKCVLNACISNPVQCDPTLCRVLPPTTCGGTCSQTSQCPTDHTCSGGKCILNACIGNASCTNNGCTLPATAIFDDQTDMVMVGLLLVLGGLLFYQLNGYQYLYNALLTSGTMRMLLLSPDHPLRKETEEQRKERTKHKQKIAKQTNRENFEKRFE